MTKEPKDISETKDQLERAQEGVLEMYLNRIREIYQAQPSNRRARFLAGLEKIVHGEATSLVQRRNVSNFSSSEAKRIREEAELTQTQLIREIGIRRKGWQSQLSKYESGLLRPYNPPRGEDTIKYLLWLKEYGYNPFNL